MINEIMNNIKHVIMNADINEKTKLDMLDYLSKMEYDNEHRYLTNKPMEKDFMNLVTCNAPIKLLNEGDNSGMPSYDI